MENLIIEEANSKDVIDISLIHKEIFLRQKGSLQWITSNFNAYPKTIFYVPKINNKNLGYIQLTQKSGFRTESVIEIEQIAVLKEYQSPYMWCILFTF